MRKAIFTKYSVGTKFLFIFFYLLFHFKYGISPPFPTISKGEHENAKEEMAIIKYFDLGTDEVSSDFWSTAL